MTATPPEQSPFADLGLPPTWVPAPLGFSLAKRGINTPQGTQTMHVLIIDCATGRQAFAFDADSLRRLGTQMIEQASGLKIASTVEQNGEGKWQPR